MLKIDKVQTRIGVLIVVISLISFVVSGAYDYNSMRNNMLEELNQKADGLVERLSESLITPLWNVDQAAINRILLSEMNDKRIKAILVTEDNGNNVFSGKIRNEVWEIVNFSAWPIGKFVKRKAEISIMNQPIGAVEIFLSPKFIDDELYQSLLSSLLRTMLLVILINLALFVTMRRILISPITKLSQTARQISLDKNYSARVKIECKGEMESLVKNFNNMLQQIEEQDLKLKQYSGQLQEKIHQSNKNLENSYRELKIINRELEMAKDEAEAASKSKSEFMANVSHEIRTPMNAIIGMADLTMETSLSNKQREFLKIIISSGKVLLRLINDILDFSKIEAGKLSLEEVNFNLHQLIHDISDLFVEQMVASQTELVIDIRPDVPQRIIGDPLRLRQVLVNITANAFKFTSKGEIIITVSADQISSNKAEIVFAIKDTGIGIPEDVQPHLFEAFKQADGSTTRKYGGTGLGLSISKRIVNLMGGNIWFRSRPEDGSTFFFTITPDVAAEPSSVDFEVPQELNNYPVLVVDDNFAVRSVLVRYLKQFGFQPTSVPDAEQALKLIEEKKDNQFKLVIIDLKLPGMSGDEASIVIRKTYDTKELPIMMITATELNTALAKAQKAQINRMISKPLKQATLFNSIMEVFGYDAPEEYFNEPSKPVENEFKDFRLLLVEDNPINQQVAEQVLEPTGIEIVAAPNGAEAVKMVQETGYDIVLMDIQMPEMDGYEATAIIRNDLGMKELPIIAMTAHAMRGDKERCLASGMDDYIPKPIDKEQMFSTIRAYLKQNKKQEQPAVLETTQTPSNPGSSDIKCHEIDISDVLERIGGDMEILVSILRNFKDYNTQFSADVQKMLQADQLKEAGDKAHTLKGSAANISAGDLTMAALELEKACKSDLREEAGLALEKTTEKLNLLHKEISLLEKDFG
ncbi:response regulator [Desulfovibrio sp. JC022]|uniref:response regulator n=1 Tax=Desulfovibrio sp. JC022 TaxID=2593642 RepID=UPI0013D1D2FB|nr:response regulator [Desulfovibrio sp. JC022]NDV22571.1 response regulator [Desulfovibrio sp. JC022]